MQAVDAINYTIKMPVGVAGLISPWNLPMYLLTFKLAPAIIAGNTVVSKPSEMTSVTAWKLGELMNEAGRYIMTSRLTCFWGFTFTQRHIQIHLYLSIKSNQIKSNQISLLVLKSRNRIVTNYIQTYIILNIQTANDLNMHYNTVSHRRRKSLKDNRFDFTDDMYISMTPLLFAFV